MKAASPVPRAAAECAQAWNPFLAAKDKLDPGRTQARDGTPPHKERILAFWFLSAIQSTVYCRLWVNFI